MLAIEGSTASGEPFKVADQCEFACQTKAPSNQEHEHCVAWIFNRVDSRFGGVGSCTLLSKFVRAGIVAPKQMATVTSGVNCPDLTPQVGEEKEAGILVTSIVELAGGEDKEDETRLATKEKQKQKQELKQQQRQEQKQQQQHQQEEQEEQEQEQAQAHQQEHQQERTQREKQRQKQEQKRAQEKQEKQHQKQEKQHEKQEQQQKQHQRAQEQQKQQQEQKQKQKATSKEDDDW
jgi:hypothetical protein